MSEQQDEDDINSENEQEENVVDDNDEFEDAYDGEAEGLLEEEEDEININLEFPRMVRWRNALLRRLHRQPHGGQAGALEFGFWRNWVGRRHINQEDIDDDDDGGGDNEERLPENITFDKNLPISHSYLGEMEECSGVSYQDHDTYQTLHVIYVNEFVLIPGQTLPLQISRLNEISMIRHVMEQPDKTFGVLTMQYSMSDENIEMRELYDFGCTAEIRSFQDREEYEVNTLRVVAVGRQKFKVMEKRTQIDGNVIAKVKIISDVELPSLSSSVGMCSNSACLQVNRQSEGSVSNVWKPLERNYYTKWCVMKHTAMSTAWPSWVHRMYDVSYLRMEIFKELKEWNQQLQECQCPEGATDFSFWVITMLPLNDTLRLRLLRVESAVQRLRYELDLLQKCTVLSCSDCSQIIANRRDVFSMSVSGPMAAYVNPGGVVHETLTLHKASGISRVGRKSTEHSWFPGYAWTICECLNCGRHMGWKFTATREDLIPQKFWGLTRSALSHQVSYGGGRNDGAADVGHDVTVAI